MDAVSLTVPARDGFELSARRFGSGDPGGRVVLINPATATPSRFYRHFATGLAERGYTVVTYDYRGIAGSKPGKGLRGFEATMCDWALRDMAGMVDWIGETLAPKRLFLVGHSFGGQVAGLLDNAGAVDAMVTLSAQSGHWRWQGEGQRLPVWFHTHVTLPVLCRAVGYMPWSWMGAEDLPKGAALEWAAWCRDPQYLLGDDSLPLDRYAAFEAPVLAYSIEDDAWGTATSVDKMMGAYPNLERRHLVAKQAGLDELGHFGYFKAASAPAWDEAMAWLDAR